MVLNIFIVLSALLIFIKSVSLINFNPVVYVYAQEESSSSAVDSTPKPESSPNESSNPAPDEGQLTVVLPDTSACLTTDKSDYAPTDSALISGTGLTPNTTYILVVSSKDKPLVNFQTNITTDNSGGFVYAYQLDGNYRINYFVTLKDLADNIVASTSFTDTTQPAEIHGIKFEDHNGNGTKDGSGDQGLQNWTIFLDANVNGVKDFGETSTNTEVGGSYSFTNLSVGTYQVREVAQAGWTQTTTNPADVLLSSGQVVNNVNFGNFQLFEISGKKFNDLNGDGIRTNGTTDPNLPGWTIRLDKEGANSPPPCSGGSINGEFCEKITDAFGNYSFTGLGPGSYIISELLQDGWQQTAPISLSGLGGQNDGTYHITGSSGTNRANRNFGNFKKPKLTVKKHVINDNGGDTLASDFTIGVSATNPSSSSFPGDESGTTITLNAGIYNVTETGPSGYTESDSADCSGTIALGETKTCTITNDDRPSHIIVIKEVTNDNGGTKNPADFIMHINGEAVGVGMSFPGAADPGVNNEVNGGDYEVTEDGVSGYSPSFSEDCKGTITNGETKTCTITNDDIDPTITLIKDVKNDDGGNALPDDFHLTLGGNPVNSGDKTPVDANTPIALNETLLSGYTFVSITGDAKCPEVLGGTVTPSEGEDITCTIHNDDTAPLVTRTLGFWQTHTVFTTSIFNSVGIGSSIPIGTAPHKGFIVNTRQLFGAFYSSIPKTTTGTNRLALDKARMQLLQQLVATKLNCAKFGCSASTLASVATADTNYAGFSISAILSSASALDTYNNSGDGVPIGGGSATPAASQLLADKVFWNSP